MMPVSKIKGILFGFQLNLYWETHSLKRMSVMSESPPVNATSLLRHVQPHFEGLAGTA